MLKITETEVFGWRASIRGMRNPLESWDKSDSDFSSDLAKEMSPESEYHLGPNDLALMKKLVAAGTDHSKFMRMIHVQCDWEAPLYWWKEADTYKVGTVRNSCSTMHKITDKEFTLDDFTHEHLIDYSLYYCDAVEEPVINGAPHVGCGGLQLLNLTINVLNYYREKYLVALKTEEECGISAKEIWWQLIQLLPSSYLQKATMDLNYATLRNMYHSRKYHKQDEWRKDFCNWVKTLPYSELITMTKEELLESIKEE